MTIASADIHFNPFKHHLACVCRLLRTIETVQASDKQLLFDTFKNINANVVDVYTGRLSPEEIKEAITDKLTMNNIGAKNEFLNCLGPKGFREIVLPDESVWILRKGEYKEAFVHIHPSRKPPLAVRIHGNAWRTVVAFLILFPEFKTKIPTLGGINAFRKKFIGLSPVKGTGNMQRIMNVYNLIVERMNGDL
jgi:hypothetical protein